MSVKSLLSKIIYILALIFLMEILTKVTHFKCRSQGKGAEYRIPNVI